MFPYLSAIEQENFKEKVTTKRDRRSQDEQHCQRQR